MELKDVFSQLSNLDASTLAEAGQVSIELGECLVKLSETIEQISSLRSAGFAVHLPGLEVFSQVVCDSMVGGPSVGGPESNIADQEQEPRQLSTPQNRKVTRQEIAEALKAMGKRQATTKTLAKIFGVNHRRICGAVQFGTGPAMHIDDGLVVLGENPDPDAFSRDREIKQRRIRVAEAAKTNPPKPQSQSDLNSFNELAYSQKQPGEFDTELADRIYTLLDSEGSLPVEVIAARLGIERQLAEQTCEACEWFCPTLAGDIRIAMV